MATKPKVPPPTVPIIDIKTGRMTKDWYDYFASLPATGEVDTTATAGTATLPAAPVGFETFTLNGEIKKRPFYDP